MHKNTNFLHSQKAYGSFYFYFVGGMPTATFCNRFSAIHIFMLTFVPIKAKGCPFHLERAERRPSDLMQIMLP